MYAKIFTRLRCPKKTKMLATAACISDFESVRTHTCTHTYTHSHMYGQHRKDMNAYIFINTHTHTNSHAHTNAHEGGKWLIWARISIVFWIRTHTHTQTHTHTHIHTHTHTHIQTLGGNMMRNYYLILYMFHIILCVKKRQMMCLWYVDLQIFETKHTHTHTHTHYTQNRWFVIGKRRSPECLGDNIL